MFFKAVLWGKDVAVKVIKKHSKITHKDLQEFVKEVKMLAGLRHPNIVLFMGACAEKAMTCIITEYLANGSLYSVLHNSRIEIEFDQQIRMCIDIALGVNYLHKLGIIHRDLKSHNLLVDESFTVKVGDFGLSSFKKDISGAEKPYGTTQWMAPEIFTGASPSEKTDVYSFGIILWEIVTRLDPYDKHMDYISVEAAVLREERPLIPNSCPAHLAELITHCWDMDPKKRPPFEQIVEQLKDLLPKRKATMFGDQKKV